VVLSVTLFIVTRITDDIEEPIKIISYADDWMAQKTMNRTIKWTEDTKFKVSMEKNKAIMFSRRKFQKTIRPRMNI
jgi:hypothetical protein